MHGHIPTQPPGIVLETCGDKRNRTTLSTEGILNINPNCSYTITNGPFVQAQMPSNVAVYPLTSNDDDRSKAGDKTNNSIVRDHFDRNDLYYIIGLCFGILITWLIVLVIWYRTGCSLRYGRYTVQLPASRTRAPRPRVELYDMEEQMPENRPPC